MRSNWKKVFTAFVVAALLSLMTIVAFSQEPQGPGRGGFRGGPPGLGPIFHDLNLTDDQKAQIKKLADSFEASTKPLRDQLRTLHQSEPDPMSGNFDEAAVRSASEARAKVEVELDVARARMMSQVFALLTTDQKAQLVARRQQFQEKHPE